MLRNHMDSNAPASSQHILDMDDEDYIRGAEVYAPTPLRSGGNLHDIISTTSVYRDQAYDGSGDFIPPPAGYSESYMMTTFPPYHPHEESVSEIVDLYTPMPQGDAEEHPGDTADTTESSDISCSHSEREVFVATLNLVTVELEKIQQEVTRLKNIETECNQVKSSNQVLENLLAIKQSENKLDTTKFENTIKELEEKLQRKDEHIERITKRTDEMVNSYDKNIQTIQHNNRKLEARNGELQEKCDLSKLQHQLLLSNTQSKDQYVEAERMKYMASQHEAEKTAQRAWETVNLIDQRMSKLEQDKDEKIRKLTQEVVDLVYKDESATRKFKQQDAQIEDERRMSRDRDYEAQILRRELAAVTAERDQVLLDLEERRRTRSNAHQFVISNIWQSGEERVRNRELLHREIAEKILAASADELETRRRQRAIGRQVEAATLIGSNTVRREVKVGELQQEDQEYGTERREDEDEEVVEKDEEIVEDDDDNEDDYDEDDYDYYDYYEEDDAYHYDGHYHDIDEEYSDDDNDSSDTETDWQSTSSSVIYNLEQFSMVGSISHLINLPERLVDDAGSVASTDDYFWDVEEFASDLLQD